MMNALTSHIHHNIPQPLHYSDSIVINMLIGRQISIHDFTADYRWYTYVYTHARTHPGGIVDQLLSK